MTLTTKIGAGVLATGSIAGLGYAGSTYFKDDGKDVVNNSLTKQEKVDTIQHTTKISDLITKEHDYILLNTSDDGGDQDKWSEKWESYKKAKDNVFNLEGWDADNTNLNLTSELKKKCGTLASSNNPDDSNVLYGNIIKYCTRGVTFEEQAKKDKAEILETNTEKHSKIWTDRFNKKTELDAELKKLRITDNVSNGDSIKNGCNTAKSQNKQIEDFKAIYEAYKKVCTKQKGEN